METNQVKIAFQDPETGLYEINKLGSNEPGKFLTESDLEKLIALMLDTRWIIVGWCAPPQKQKPTLILNAARCNPFGYAYFSRMVFWLLRDRLNDQGWIKFGNDEQY